MQQPQGPLNDWWHTRDIVKLPFLLVLESYVLKDYSLEEVKRILIFGLDINLRYKTWMWIWTWTFPVSGDYFRLGFCWETSLCMCWSGGLVCSVKLQHSQASARDVLVFWHVSPPNREIVKCFCLKVVWRLKGSFSVLFSEPKIEQEDLQFVNSLIILKRRPERVWVMVVSNKRKGFLHLIQLLNVQKYLSVCSSWVLFPVWNSSHLCVFIAPSLKSRWWKRGFLLLLELQDDFEGNVYC